MTDFCAIVNTYTLSGLTSLHFAVFKGHRDVAEWLVANGADCQAVDGSGRLPVHLAALAGSVELLELLTARLEDPSSLLATTPEGLSLAHFAALGGVSTRCVTGPHMRA